MKHSPLTKYFLYHILDAAFSLRQEYDEENLEHLHTFRVSLRLVRSLFLLYIPDSTLFPTPLKAFLKATNLLRDLDVLLLSLHQKSSQKIVKQLISFRNERYKSLFTNASKIQNLKALDELYDCIANLNPIFTNDYLIQTADKHYEESLNAYVTLAPSASPKELHKLRIRFKISRYAFDFLNDSGLKKTTKKLEESKELQDKLGEIHDLYNQVKLLKILQKESKGLKKLIVARKKEFKRSINALTMSKR
ncbi:MAG: CHAD domain-containing protein [Campylobacterales bacterium]|nr:CHAD domain-containing protein [Campylobacterales bacterium]